MSAKYVKGIASPNSQGVTRFLYFDDGSTSITEVKWGEVTRVVAFKRDLFAFDLLCLGFEIPVGIIEIDEEMEGWQKITEELPKHLPGTRAVPDWWPEGVNPAFATNLLEIFPPK